VPRRLASDCLDEFAAALAAEGCLCLLLHPDDLHGWSEEQRARFEALTQRYLPRRAEFPARFGPKQLSLTVFSSR